MTERLVRPALHAICEAIEGIEEAVGGKTLDDFSRDWLLRHGVQRGIEIISEATRRIPPDLQALRPSFGRQQKRYTGQYLKPVLAKKAKGGRRAAE